MSSESETAQSQTRSILERLTDARNRDLALFLPFLIGLHGPDPDQSSDRQSIVLINPFTQGLVVIEGANFSSLFQSDPDKIGRPPASKASIEALQSVEVAEDEAGECAICLEEWGIGGGGVKELPCKHRFHGGCVEKWLGIHGSCPVCRFEMPCDQEEGGRKSNNGGVLLSLGFSFGGRIDPDRSSSGDVDQSASDGSSSFDQTNASVD